MNPACSGFAHAMASDLEELNLALQKLPELEAKGAICHAAVDYGDLALATRYQMPGDDCAAFATAGGYQLLAMEGMLPGFVNHDPRAAGWSSVMANVSDIAAMGGRPQAVVNAYWHHDSEQAKTLLFHIKRACDVFGVQFAGGHSSIQPDYSPGLAVAITGFARNLLSCHHLKAGQRLFLLSDLDGSWHGDFPYWACVQGKSKAQIQSQWRIPAQLAEEGLAVAAKDISNGGVLGTLLMMLELNQCGAAVDLCAIPSPDKDFLRWMRAFQSFGFLLAVEPSQVSSLLGFFKHSHLTCAAIGEINDSAQVSLDMAGASATFWNLKQRPLTGMGVQAGDHSASS